MSARRAPLAAVVLTFNEERNIAACLASVADWAEQVFVVDSGSTDATTTIALNFGASVVSHAFETHARQWNWALRTLPIRSEWVLALDADQRVTPELATEIQGTLAMQPAADGFYLRRRQIFRGRWIRHGGYYPKYLLKLFRRGKGSADEEELVDHHFRVAGPTARMRADLIEQNENEWEICAWTARHARYARLQAEEELRRLRALPANTLAARLFGSPDERVLWVKTRIWSRLPLYLRPFLYFAYRYFLRCGFLDGKEGLVFHFLQACWYRLLVDINLEELRRVAAQGPEP